MEECDETLLNEYTLAELQYLLCAENRKERLSDQPEDVPRERRFSDMDGLMVLSG